ncbi:MAG: hypothetical protein H7A23_02965 [Leptospiraceae bacterium]|nr:hypothetical protein [Leptospiraceae bacterium]MCP5493492.1 hypothetical protein [Leptospiraceae bacterium]
MFFEKELERIQKNVSKLEYIDDALIKLGFIISEIESSKIGNKLITDEKKEFEDIEQKEK